MGARKVEGRPKEGTCPVRMRHVRLGADEAVHDGPSDDHVACHGKCQPRDEVWVVNSKTRAELEEETHRRQSDGSRAQS